MIHTWNVGKDENIVALKNIINRFAKGAKIPALVLGATLATGSITSCLPITGGTRIERTNISPDQPYNKTIDFGAYRFHNFLGKQPNIISSTATQDINNYIDMGVLYVENAFNEFQQSIDGRDGLVRYFTPVKFNPDERRYPYTYHASPNAKMDGYINQIAGACEIVMTDMVRSLSTTEQKEDFILCLRALSLANYYETMGNQRNQNSPMMSKYSQELSSILAFWLNSQFLKSVDLVNDIENSNCRRITDKLYTLLCYVKGNMPYSVNVSGLQNLTLKDLQGVINLTLLIPAWEGAHDYTATMQNHQHCTMHAQKLIQAMQNVAGNEQKANYGKDF